VIPGTLSRPQPDEEQPYGATPTRPRFRIPRGQLYIRSYPERLAIDAVPTRPTCRTGPQAQTTASSSKRPGHLRDAEVIAMVS